MRCYTYLKNDADSLTLQQRDTPRPGRRCWSA
jgi:hypothetical protein